MIEFENCHTKNIAVLKVFLSLTETICGIHSCLPKEIFLSIVINMKNILHGYYVEDIAK